MGFLELQRQCGVSHEVLRGAQGASHVAPGHSLHRLLCSRSRGAERWVRGAAGGAEARAGWGRGSERVRVDEGSQLEWW